MNTCISAVQHLRPLRGGAQSHLLKASDGACYVTKFQNNPQHIRVLANEMLATNLGLALGLPMPRVEVIEVSDWLIEQTEDLRISLGGSKIPCRSGKQLGSLYVGCESPGMSFDYLPRELLQRVLNIADFASGSCPGQVDVQQRRTAGDLLSQNPEKPATPRYLYRPGLLLQCRRVDVSRTLPCEAYTRTIAFTRVSWDGRRLSRRSVEPKRWMLTPFGGALPRFPKSGTKEIETV